MAMFMFMKSGRVSHLETVTFYTEFNEGNYSPKSGDRVFLALSYPESPEIVRCSHQKLEGALSMSKFKRFQKLKGTEILTF